MTSSGYLGHVNLPDAYDWLKSAANFLLSIDQTLLLPLTVLGNNTPEARFRPFSGSHRKKTVLTQIYFCQCLLPGDIR